VFPVLSDRPFQWAQAVLAELQHYFRPEFLNRVDDIVVFHSLSEKTSSRFWKFNYTTAGSRLGRTPHQHRVDTEAAKPFGAPRDTTRSMARRPLKRAIQKELETPIGRLLLRGEVRDGQTVMVDGRTASYFHYQRSRSNRARRGREKVRKTVTSDR